MKQKKSPATTGPTTQKHSDNTIISDCLEFIKTLYPELTIGGGRYE